MMDYTKCQVRYPSPAFMESALSWYEYPLKGFRDIGADVTIDPDLDDQSRSKLGYQVTAIDIEWPGQKPRRVYYDWCDFDSNHPHLIAEHDPPALYYKVMCRPSMLDLGIRPIGQTVSRMAFFDHLESFREATSSEANNDVTAVFRTTARDLRCKAVQIVRDGPWTSIAHVWDYPRRNPAPTDIVRHMLPYADHLHTQSQSKVNIALPGVGGDWTWRHVELLAMGAFMLTIEPEYLLPGNPVGSIALCDRGLSNLADMIQFWLDNEDERRAMAARGRAYYEESLSPAAMARTMLDGA